MTDGGRVDVDVLFLDLAGTSDDGVVLPDEVRETFSVRRVSTVTTAADVLAERAVACVVVAGAGSTVADAVTELTAADGSPAVLAAVEEAIDDVAVDALEAGADDLVPVENVDGENDDGRRDDVRVRVVKNRVENAVRRRRNARQASVTYESRDALLDEASVPVLLVGNDGRVVHATGGAATYLGYGDAPAMVGERVESFVHPADRERAMVGLYDVLEGGTSTAEVELRLLTADGEIRHAAVTTSPAYYDDELVAQTVAKDVTDRHDPVRALTRRGAVLPAALDGLEDLLFVADAEWRIQFGNEHLRELLGYDEATVQSLDPASLFPSTDRDAAVAALETALDGNAVAFETRVSTATGGTIDCEFRLRPVENDDGDVVGVVGVGQDVGERVRRERALRTLNTVGSDLKTRETPTEASERTVAAATEVLDMEFCGVSLLEDDDYLDVVAASDELEETWTMRMSVDDGVAGLTYRTGESFHVDDLDAFEDADPKGAFQSVISVPVGEYGVFQAVANAPSAFDETDLELAELLAGHLTTALSRIDRVAQLREQNERLSEFANVVSHDLRNPLTLMQAELEMAEERGDPEDFERVRDAITRMDALIDDLLTLARAGEGVAALEPVAVATAVTEAWAPVSSTEASVTVGDVPTVDADPTRFRQLLENLFRNAVEHGSTSNRTESGDAVEHGSTSNQTESGDAVEHADAGVSVTVDALADDDGFYVADDGPGIPPEKRERVFESGYTTATDGTGFGLRIVADVADAHDWSVSVTESADGGARFEFRT
ncbi:PAS domain-containing sensor histidine kinase [Halorubellus salinus]|uniref:PAS domain-containing sensor histidine kinase n=1 Tax=Halorubellus salinus TaxID=755309 RepID=UPI001D08AACF|nr:PAS domain S-box protein [Halorubellus salinus]